MAQNGDSNQNENQNVAAQQHENVAAQQHESDLQNDDLQEYYRTSKIPFIIFLKDLRYVYSFVYVLLLTFSYFRLLLKKNVKTISHPTAKACVVGRSRHDLHQVGG